MNSKFYNNIIWYGLAAIMVFAPVVLGANRLWSITTIELTVLVLIFVWFWRMNNETGWHFNRTDLDLPILLFVVLAFISSFFSMYLHDSIFAMKRLLAMAAIYYLVVNNFGEKSTERFLTLIVAIGTVLSLFGFAQHFLEWPRSWWANEDFLTSTYVNHNHFAGYLEMVIPVSLGLFFSEKVPIRKIIFACTAVIMAIAFIFAQSRGAWVSLAFATLLITYFLSKKRIIGRYNFFIIALLILLVFTVLYAGEDSVASRLEKMTDVKGDASFMTRVETWRGTIEMIKHNPSVGTGIGTLVWGFPPYRPAGLNVKVDYAHNDYLQMMAEMGVLALPIMLWFVILVLRRGFSVLSRPVYAGITTGLLSIFIHGLVDFNFHIPANMILFTSLCAFLMLGAGKGKNP